MRKGAAQGACLEVVPETKKKTEIQEQTEKLKKMLKSIIKGQNKMAEVCIHVCTTSYNICGDGNEMLTYEHATGSSSSSALMIREHSDDPGVRRAMDNSQHIPMSVPKRF